MLLLSRLKTIQTSESAVLIFSMKFVSLLLQTGPKMGNLDRKLGCSTLYKHNTDNNDMIHLREYSQSGSKAIDIKEKERESESW